MAKRAIEKIERNYREANVSAEVLMCFGIGDGGGCAAALDSNQNGETSNCCRLFASCLRCILLAVSLPFLVDSLPFLVIFTAFPCLCRWSTMQRARGRAPRATDPGQGQCAQSTQQI